MIGPKHYKIAQGTLDEVAVISKTTALTKAEAIAVAQVHATLALAAATALHGTPMLGAQAWFNVCGATDG